MNFSNMSPMNNLLIWNDQGCFWNWVLRKWRPEPSYIPRLAAETEFQCARNCNIPINACFVQANTKECDAIVEKAKTGFGCIIFD